MDNVSRRNFLTSSVAGATAFQIIKPELVRGQGNEKLKAGYPPKALDQWDLRRAVLRALLPSGELRRRYGIRTDAPWGNDEMGPIPCVVRTDNGKIEASRQRSNHFNSIWLWS